MPLSWNEIKSRAIQFSKEWETETAEHAEAKSFWDDFFNVFGIHRRRVATFEQRVWSLREPQRPVEQFDNLNVSPQGPEIKRRGGFIDLLWKGHLLVEHKSSGKDLDRAYQQAKDYFPGLTDNELPKYILVCNFQMFRLYNLDEGTQHEFALKDLVKNVQHFAFIAGYQKRTFKDEDPVNIIAAERMGKLHDKLQEIGYKGHQLEIYLVRLLFCLFADDTNIFEKGIFEEYIETKTKEDGSDLASHLAHIFQVLNTPRENRLSNLDEALNAFPYVNGKLFEEHLPLASFDSAMRQTLLYCCELNWGKISPAIFGSLFQSVMNPVERRNLGAHYTSEKNILKLIKPLFLDKLWQEFESIKNNRNKLIKLHDKIATLRFLDPACGCGNFLVITYRELRLLEIEIIKHLQTKDQLVTDVSNLFKVDVDRYYGIEYEEFPAQIAQVAMWLIDHQMNMLASETFGEYFVRLPLKKSAVIANANALRMDWQSLIDPLPWEKKAQRYDFILGNPPFVGYSLQNKIQKEDIDLILGNVKGTGVLDYVTCWYIKAAQYLQEHSPHNNGTDEDGTQVAFVSTNSIAQGEQVGILWNELFNRYKIKIHFAHRTFSWTNEARGKAAVHVVIIGFSNFDVDKKYIYEYDNIKGEPHQIEVQNINPYLVESKDYLIKSRSEPIRDVSKMIKGSQPTDGGNFLLTDEEKNELIKKEPKAIKYIKPFISAREFIKGDNRWCLWLKDITPRELQEMPLVKSKVMAVKEMRMKSNKAATVKWAQFPTLFTENRQPNSQYVLVPSHSSENRKYIPIGFMSENDILNNSCFSVPNATLYEFGILTSEIHMSWVKYVCGRLESRYRYSNSLVYNNFPWPENPTEKQKAAIEQAAQKVLDVRKEFEGSSLADLYDPVAMPPKLVKAHQDLDKAVDLAYRPQPFTSETKRIEFLFELYEKYTSGLFGVRKKGRK
jgi:hypothetical protein